VTSSWSFILQLLNDAQSNKHKIQPILFVKWYRAVSPSLGATDPQRAKRVPPKALKIHLTFYLSRIPEAIVWFVLLLFASVIITNKISIHLL